MHFKTIYGALEIVTHAEEQQKNLRDLGKRKRKQKKIKGKFMRQRDKGRKMMKKSVKEMLIPLFHKY